MPTRKCPDCLKEFDVADGRTTCPQCEVTLLPSPGAPSGPQKAPPRPARAQVVPPAVPVAAAVPTAQPVGGSEAVPLQARRPVAKPAAAPRRSPLPAVIAGVVAVTALVGIVVLVVVLTRGPKPEVVEQPPSVAPTPPSAAIEKPVGDPPAAEAAATGEAIYRRLLEGTTFIVSRSSVSTSAGSGFLVDRDHRIVVTNYHVVQERPLATIFFADYDDRLEPIMEVSHYKNRESLLGISGRVVGTFPSKDLALVELDRIPPQARPLPLASSPARPGANVWSMGSSGVQVADFSGTLWRQSSGPVRSRSNFRRQISGQAYDMMAIETQKPVNSGDSGGPTVNDRGEVVGVVAVGEKGVNLVNHDIDVTEVRAMLTQYARGKGWGWKDVDSRSLEAPGVELARLKKDLKASDARVRIEAVGKLGAMENAAQAAVPDLLFSLTSLPADEHDGIVEALDKIGLPNKSDLPTVAIALRSNAPAARRYALTLYADRLTAAPSVQSDLAQFLSHEEVATRLLALRACAVERWC